MIHNHWLSKTRPSTGCLVAVESSNPSLAGLQTHSPSMKPRQLLTKCFGRAGAAARVMPGAAACFNLVQPMPDCFQADFLG
jgi:hypothetical protein